ncbi:arsenite efflux membrane protein ArsB [Knoellia remsis]|uniref:Arsenite efflux membrane protein ArsB n=1 Tax=Knoellia remsis TaxID=407159 RepID=A0A2T0UH41_9MICO|nr:SLC13 family permease [Knoellia remsis]PRY57137.1 arsenite efflux membrane protein ArsB [Knoellia remsis]
MTGAELADLATRIGPVMLFLVTMTVVAEVAQIAGVFDVAAHWTARAGRHRTWLLWLLVVALAVVCTIVLSIDTTAVLLTPVVIAVARQLRLPAMPFALTTVWLANTASLLLPVSNLTNLIALHHFSRLGLGTHEYVALAWRPALAAIVATVAVLFVMHRRELLTRYAPEAPDDPHDRTLLVIAAIVCVALGPAFVSGVTPAIPATVAAVVLVVALAVRRRDQLSEVQVPWVMVLLVCVLFVAIDVALRHGLEPVLSSLAGTGSSSADLWRVGATGALTANLVNNLPAYLALEPVAADTPARLMALLIGVNAGSIVTVWGSLATVLWRARCRRAGVAVPLVPYAARSLVCALAAVGAGLLALTLG